MRFADVAKFVVLALYVGVTRTILAVAILFTALFFILNSGPFPALLTSALHAALPGSLNFGTIQMSPVPWKVDVSDFTITTPDNTPVIWSKTVHVKIDLVPLLKFLTGQTPNTLGLHFNDVELVDYGVLLDFDDDNNLKLVEAFQNNGGDDSGDQPNTFNVSLKFDRVTGQKGRVHLAFPEWGLDLEDIDIKAALTIETLDTHVKVWGPELTYKSGNGHIRAVPGVKAIPQEIKLGPGRLIDYVYDWDNIAFRRFDMTAEGMEMIASDGHLNWMKLLDYGGKAELRFANNCPLVETATMGWFSGPLNVTVSGRGNVVDPRFELSAGSVGPTIAGVALDSAEVSVHGGRDTAGWYAFSQIFAAVQRNSASVEVKDGVLHPFGDSNETSLSAMAFISFSKVSVPEIWDKLQLALPHKAIPLPETVDGTAQIRAFTLADQSAATVLSAVASVDGDLRPGSVLAGNRFSSRLSASLSMAEDSATTIKVEAFSLRSGADSLSLKGSLDLDAGSVFAVGAVSKDLASVAKMMGVAGRGTVDVSNLRLSGHLPVPRIKGDLRAHDLAFGPWSAVSVQAKMAVEDGRASLKNATVESTYSKIGVGEVALVFLDRTTGKLLNNPKLLLSQAVFTGVDLRRLPVTANMGLIGRGDAEVERLSIDVGSSLKTLAGRGNLSFSKIKSMGRALTGIKADWSCENGVFRVGSATARLRGGGDLALSGRLDLARLKAKAELKADDLSLAALAGMKADGDVNGKVSGVLSVDGPISDPAISATVSLKNLVLMGRSYGPIDLVVDRKIGDSLFVSADRWWPHMSLNPQSGLVWKGGRFAGVVAMVDLNRLSVQDVIPSVAARTLWGQVTGNVQFRMGFGPGATLSAEVNVPPDGLNLGFFNREVHLVNRERMRFAIEPNGAVIVEGLALDDGRGDVLRACGEVLNPDGLVNLRVRGPVGMYWLRALKETFSEAEGIINLSAAPGMTTGPLPPGCRADVNRGEGAMAVRGTMTSPLLNGVVTTGKIDVQVRRYPDAIHVRDGGRIIFSDDGQGRLRAEIPTDYRIKGAVGEGAFTLEGNVGFMGLVPDSGNVTLNGTGIRFVIPGEFYLVGNPFLTMNFSDVSTAGMSSVLLTGRFAITEGSYHKNFDIVHQVFSGVTGTKVAQRAGRPLRDVVPWLADANLDIAITGANFGVRSKVLVGTTDFDMGMNLRLRGTVSSPELWNRIEIVHGGKVTYDLVRREFEVLRGTLDFTGDPKTPLVDVSARTRVEYQGSTGTSVFNSSRFAADDMDASTFDDNQIVVNLKVTGRYPDLDIDLSSSTRALSDNDLQYLLLTGTVPGESGDLMNSTFNLGLLTEDVANLMAKVLFSSFVDAVSFGVSPSGGVNVDVMAHMGSRLKFSTQVLQQTGTSRYSAGFQVRLTEGLSLQGRVKAVEYSLDESEIGKKYETKLRYRIPLE